MRRHFHPYRERNEYRYRYGESHPEQSQRDYDRSESEQDYRFQDRGRYSSQYRENFDSQENVFRGQHSNSNRQKNYQWEDSYRRDDSYPRDDRNQSDDRYQQDGRYHQDDRYQLDQRDDSYLRGNSRHREDKYQWSDSSQLNTSTNRHIDDRHESHYDSENNRRPRHVEQRNHQWHRQSAPEHETFSYDRSIRQGDQQEENFRNRSWRDQKVTVHQRHHGRSNFFRRPSPSSRWDKESRDIEFKRSQEDRNNRQTAAKTSDETNPDRQTKVAVKLDNESPSVSGKSNIRDDSEHSVSVTSKGESSDNLKLKEESSETYHNLHKRKSTDEFISQKQTPIQHPVSNKGVSNQADINHQNIPSSRWDKRDIDNVNERSAEDKNMGTADNSTSKKQTETGVVNQISANKKGTADSSTSEKLTETDEVLDNSHSDCDSVEDRRIQKQGASVTSKVEAPDNVSATLQKCVQHVEPSKKESSQTQHDLKKHKQNDTHCQILKTGVSNQTNASFPNQNLNKEVLSRKEIVHPTKQLNKKVSSQYQTPTHYQGSSVQCPEQFDRDKCVLSTESNVKQVDLGHNILKQSSGGKNSHRHKHKHKKHKKEKHSQKHDSEGKVTVELKLKLVKELDLVTKKVHFVKEDNLKMNKKESTERVEKRSFESKNMVKAQREKTGENCQHLEISTPVTAAQVNSVECYNTDHKKTSEVKTDTHRTNKQSARDVVEKTIQPITVTDKGNSRSDDKSGKSSSGAHSDRKKNSEKYHKKDSLHTKDNKGLGSDENHQSETSTIVTVNVGNVGCNSVENKTTREGEPDKQRYASQIKDVCDQTRIKQSSSDKCMTKHTTVNDKSTSRSDNKTGKTSSVVNLEHKKQHKKDAVGSVGNQVLEKFTSDAAKVDKARCYNVENKKTTERKPDKQKTADQIKDKYDKSGTSKQETKTGKSSSGVISEHKKKAENYLMKNPLHCKGSKDLGSKHKDKHSHGHRKHVSDHKKHNDAKVERNRHKQKISDKTDASEVYARNDSSKHHSNEKTFQKDKGGADAKLDPEMKSSKCMKSSRLSDRCRSDTCDSSKHVSDGGRPDSSQRNKHVPDRVLSDNDKATTYTKHKHVSKSAKYYDGIKHLHKVGKCLLWKKIVLKHPYIRLKKMSEEDIARFRNVTQKFRRIRYVETSSSESDLNARNTDSSSVTKDAIDMFDTSVDSVIEYTNNGNDDSEMIQPISAESGNEKLYPFETNVCATSELVRKPSMRECTEDETEVYCNASEVREIHISDLCFEQNKSMKEGAACGYIEDNSIQIEEFNKWKHTKDIQANSVDENRIGDREKHVEMVATSCRKTNESVETADAKPVMDISSGSKTSFQIDEQTLDIKNHCPAAMEEMSPVLAQPPLSINAGTVRKESDLQNHEKEKEFTGHKPGKSNAETLIGNEIYEDEETQEPTETDTMFLDNIDLGTVDEFTLDNKASVSENKDHNKNNPTDGFTNDLGSVTPFDVTFSDAETQDPFAFEEDVPKPNVSIESEIIDDPVLAVSRDDSKQDEATESDSSDSLPVITFQGRHRGSRCWTEPVSLSLKSETNTEAHKRTSRIKRILKKSKDSDADSSDGQEGDIEDNDTDNCETKCGGTINDATDTKARCKSPELFSDDDTRDMGHELTSEPTDSKATIPEIKTSLDYPSKTEVQAFVLSNKDEKADKSCEYPSHTAVNTEVKEEPGWLVNGYTQEPDIIFLSDDDDNDIIMSFSQPVIDLDIEDNVKVKAELDSDYDLFSAESGSDNGSDFEPEDIFSSLLTEDHVASDTGKKSESQKSEKGSVVNKDKTHKQCDEDVDFGSGDDMLLSVDESIFIREQKKQPGFTERRNSLSEVISSDEDIMPIFLDVKGKSESSETDSESDYFMATHEVKLPTQKYVDNYSYKEKYVVETEAVSPAYVSDIYLQDTQVYAEDEGDPSVFEFHSEHFPEETEVADSDAGDGLMLRDNESNMQETCKDNTKDQTVTASKPGFNRNTEKLIVKPVNVQSLESNPYELATQIDDNNKGLQLNADLNSTIDLITDSDDDIFLLEELDDMQKKADFNKEKSDNCKDENERKFNNAGHDGDIDRAYESATQKSITGNKRKRSESVECYDALTQVVDDSDNSIVSLKEAEGHIDVYGTSTQVFGKSKFEVATQKRISEGEQKRMASEECYDALTQVVDDSDTCISSDEEADGIDLNIYETLTQVVGKPKCEIASQKSIPKGKRKRLASDTCYDALTQVVDDSDTCNTRYEDVNEIGLAINETSAHGLGKPKEVSSKTATSVKDSVVCRQTQGHAVLDIIDCEEENSEPDAYLQATQIDIDSYQMQTQVGNISISSEARGEDGLVYQADTQMEWFDDEDDDVMLILGLSDSDTEAATTRKKSNNSNQTNDVETNYGNVVDTAIVEQVPSTSSLSTGKGILKKPTSHTIQDSTAFPPAKKVRIHSNTAKMIEPMQLKSTADKRASALAKAQGTSISLEKNMHTAKGKQTSWDLTQSSDSDNFVLSDISAQEKWLSKKSPGKSDSRPRVSSGRGRQKRVTKALSLEKDLSARVIEARCQLQERAIRGAVRPEDIADVSKKIKPSVSVTTVETEDVELPTGSQMVRLGLPLINDIGGIVTKKKGAIPSCLEKPTPTQGSSVEEGHACTYAGGATAVAAAALVTRTTSSSTALSSSSSLLSGTLASTSGSAKTSTKDRLIPCLARQPSTSASIVPTTSSIDSATSSVTMSASSGVARQQSTPSSMVSSTSSITFATSSASLSAGAGVARQQSAPSSTVSSTSAITSATSSASMSARAGVAGQQSAPSSSVSSTSSFTPATSSASMSARRGLARQHSTPSSIDLTAASINSAISSASESARGGQSGSGKSVRFSDTLHSSGTSSNTSDKSVSKLPSTSIRRDAILRNAQEKNRNKAEQPITTSVATTNVKITTERRAPLRQIAQGQSVFRQPSTMTGINPTHPLAKISVPPSRATQPPILRPPSEALPATLSNKPSIPVWEDFLKVVLKWSPKWFEEADLDRNKGQPPEVAVGWMNQEKPELFPLVERYQSFEEYSQQFMLPLLLYETWASCHKDWALKKDAKKEKHKVVQHKMMINSIEAPLELLQSFVMLGLTTRRARASGQGINRSDLVWLSVKVKAPKNNQKASEQQVMGMVEKVTYREEKQVVDSLCQKNPDLAARRQGDTIVQQVSVKVRNRKLAPVNTALHQIQVISSLVTTERAVQALRKFPGNPLYRHLLFPTCNDTFFNQARVIPAHPRDHYNTSQLQAINTVGRMLHLGGNQPQMCLIQGPPGTGKSHTIIGIIKRLIKDRKGDVRICLCTPSNAAVDELVRRLIRTGRNKDSSDQVSIIRLGRKTSLAADLQPYSLDMAVRRTWVQDAIPASLKEETEVLVKKIKILREKMEKSTDKNQKAKYGADIQKLEKQKDEISKKVKEPPGLAQNMKYCLKALQQTNVIAGTLSSMADHNIRQLYRELTAAKKGPLFHCVIIDEATQGIELDTLIPLQYGTPKLVLVGDPEQLAPTVLSQKCQDNRFNMSLFERLDSYFRYSASESPVLLLDTQYRMHPQIAHFSNNYVYEGRIKNDISVSARPKYPLLPYLLYNIDGTQLFSQGTKSMSNPEEAIFTATLCRFIVDHARIRPTSIGIIAPYNNQKADIQAQLRQRKLEMVEVSTVDGFQGQERDVIIMSCVRARTGGEGIGFVGNRNRINVALTRARHAMYILGHLDCLEVNNEWKALIDDAKERKVIVSVGDQSWNTALEKCLNT